LVCRLDNLKKAALDAERAVMALYLPYWGLFDCGIYMLITKGKDRDYYYGN